METTEKVSLEEIEKEFDEQSLKNTLFSSIVFVGGEIVVFILLLIIVYMVRLLGGN